MTECFEQFFFFCFHFLFLMLTRFVVVMDEVEEPVNEKPFQFLVETEVVFIRLSPGFMEIDDDIAKDKVLGFKF